MEGDTGGDNTADRRTDVKPVSRLRRIAPQVMASTACNLLLLNLSASETYPTVFIGQLHNSTDPLTLDDEKASWLGSTPFICQPLGSVASGFLMDIFGRKRVVTFMNLPFLVGWVLLCTAPSYTVMFVANVLVGITIGLSESPVRCYIGEVCQSDVRGILSSSGNLFYQGGFAVVMLIGSLVDWRKTAAICTALSIVAGMCELLIPETPVWLISRGRLKDAERALCWLRGWVCPSVVQQELKEISQYHENTKQNSKTAAQNAAYSNSTFVGEDETPPAVTVGKTGDVEVIDDDEKCCDNFVQGLREMWRPSTRRPLLLVIFFMLFTSVNGYIPARPFMVQVFQQFQVPTSVGWATVIPAVAGMLGALIPVLTVRRFGKRPVALVSAALGATSTLLLGVYAYLQSNGVWQVSWVPLLLFTLMALFHGSLVTLPWSLLCEVFPFRTKGLSVGIGSASFYIFAFIAAKTFLIVTKTFHMFGAFWFYGAIYFVGFVYLYFQLPETEGKSIEEIEHFFATGMGARKSNM